MAKKICCKKTKVIMVMGTTSNAGKTLLTAGLCRIFKQDGYKVAPFKSQNMSLNSFISEEGKEMARGQVIQAEAAGIVPSVNMNPILLKPTNDNGSQVIINGKVRGQMTAAQYNGCKKQLVPDVLAAFKSLAEQYEVIVIEGAGSPAEVNLRQDDIANMGMAELVDAPVILVADIDRGGVFASLYGTVALLEKSEQDRIKGAVINKFRGDLEILRPGLATLEGLIDKPVLGVVPYMELDLDDEDSLAERLTHLGRVDEGLVEIVVIHLPHISNFTDFNPLEKMAEVNLRYVKSVHQLGQPDLLILPGTKNTMSDLLWLRQNGLEAAILKYKACGGAVLGICGGYQMLGQTLSDPLGVELSGNLEGLGLLNIATTFVREKAQTQAEGVFARPQGVFESLSGIAWTGYEIHMGRTTLLNQAGTPFIQGVDYQGKAILDGLSCANVAGTYIHGLFDSKESAAGLINALLKAKGMRTKTTTLDWADYKEQQYDKLAEGLRNSLDMQKIYQILNQ